MNAKGIRESNPRFLKTAQRMTFKKKKTTKIHQTTAQIF